MFGDAQPVHQQQQIRQQARRPRPPDDSLNQQRKITETPDVLDKSPAATAAPPATVTRAESAVPRALQKYLSLDDFEPTARRRIPKFLYGYISGGAETDAARARQPQGLRRIRFCAARAQRRLRPRPDHHAVRQDLCLAVRHSADGLLGAVRLSRRHRADAGREGRKRADDSQRLVADHAGGRARRQPGARGIRPISPACRSGSSRWSTAWRRPATTPSSSPPTCRCRRTARTTSATAFRCRSRSRRACSGTRSPIRTGCSAPGRAP